MWALQRFCWRLLCLFVSFLLILPGTVSAQKSAPLSSAGLEQIADLNFETLGIRDRLPHDSVYAFTQDTQGYLWIATYGGLSRYDGYRLRNYTHDPLNSRSLLDNSVRTILPAHNGDLWVGTENAGVFVYRAAIDGFEALPNVPAIIAHSRIYCMAEDRQGGLWIGGQFGLVHYHQPSETYDIFPAQPDPGYGPIPPNTLPFKQVFAIFLDRKGTVWVGASGGVLIQRPNSTNFEIAKGLDGPEEVGAQPYVWSFFEDSSGQLWVGCDRTGMGRFDPTANVIRGVPGLAGPQSAIGSHTVRGIVQVRPHVLWIATYGGGLVTYNVQTGHIRSFTRDPTKPLPLLNNFLRGIFRDRSGVVWLATDHGVAKVNASTTGIFEIQTSPRRPGQPSGSEVRSLGNVNDQVWVGFDQGEFGPLEADGFVRAIPPAPGLDPSLIPKGEILSIRGVPPTSFEPDTVYAAGTGIFRVDLHTMTYRPLSDPRLARELVSTLCADGDLLWAGTYNGLYVINRRTGQSQVYRHEPSDPNSLLENDVRDLLLGRDGKLWITTRAGLAMRDPATGRFRSFTHIPNDPRTPPSDNVRSLTEDHSGRLWLGTTGGGLTELYKFNPDGRAVFRTFREPDGMPSDMILTVVTGKDGRIWANTSGGMAVVDPDTLNIQVYTAGDGMRGVSQKLFGSATLDDGTLLFRGPDGIVGVQPKEIVHRDFRAPLVLTRFDATGTGGDCTVPPGKHPLRLDPQRGGFVAEFALLDYTDPESTRYEYRLDGYDTQWRTPDSGQRSALYTGLPPGYYTLQLRAVGRGGRGTEVEASYEIYAPRRWQQSLWFRAALILLLILCFLVLLRLRTAYLVRRREQLQQEITLRTAELNEKGRQLEAANQRLSELAIRDPLTNLINRRHFLELATAELVRSQRSGRPFSVLLMDIDHFKQVNDTFGHLVGDEVLRGVAEWVGALLRSTDVLARYGGEEFILLMPETDELQATVLAERIRAHVEWHPFPVNTREVRVTLSIGCAETDRGDTITDLLERADQALYAAKNSGRNRTIVSPGRADPQTGPDRPS